MYYIMYFVYTDGVWLQCQSWLLSRDQFEKYLHNLSNIYFINLISILNVTAYLSSLRFPVTPYVTRFNNIFGNSSHIWNTENYKNFFRVKILLCKKRKNSLSQEFRKKFLTSGEVWHKNNYTLNMILNINFLEMKEDMKEKESARNKN